MHQLEQKSNTKKLLELVINQNYLQIIYFLKLV